jgi:hypothetical protein
VAIDSVCYDFLLYEWPFVVRNGSTTPGDSLEGGAEDYLHEMALCENPPSKTLYDPGKTGQRLQSLGAHEHWDNPVEKSYSRNRGIKAGIELISLTASKPLPELAVRREGERTVLSWKTGLAGYRLETASELKPVPEWKDYGIAPAIFEGRYVVTNEATDALGFFRLRK